MFTTVYVPAFYYVLISWFVYHTYAKNSHTTSGSKTSKLRLGVFLHCSVQGSGLTGNAHYVDVEQEQAEH